MRRLVLLAAALLAVPAALLPATAADADAVATSVGTDVASPQCPQGGFVAPSTTPDFAVVALNDGISTSSNPCLAGEVTWARTLPGASRPAFELYVNTQHPHPADASWWPTSDATADGTAVIGPYGHCRGGDDAACAYVYGAGIARGDVAQAIDAGIDPVAERWWLDVEVANDWYGSHLTNRAVLEGAAATLEADGVPVGLYATHQQWAQIVGPVSASSALAGLPSWLSAAVTRAGAAENCSHAPLVPHSRVVLAQAVSTDAATPDLDLPCARLVADPKPRVHGTARVGHLLTAAAGAWAPAGVHLSYRWLRDGRAISKATAAGYRLRAADRHHRVSVRVTGTLAGYSRGVRESAPKRIR